MIPAFDSTNPFVQALDRQIQILGVKETSGFVVVSGILKVALLRHISPHDIGVPVCVVVPRDWVALKPRIYVRCDPPWLKTGADWHVFSNRSICVEWCERWSEHLELVKADVVNIRDLADVAAQWLTRAAAHILHVHFTCFVLKKKTWPEFIPTWPHSSEEASAAYRKENDELALKQKHSREARGCRARSGTSRS